VPDNEKKPNWFKRHKVLTGILVLFILFTLIGAASGSSDTSTGTASPQPTTAAAPSYEQVDAKAMITEFDENQLSAEKKYKKKLVEFEAKISNISEDVLGTPFLSLVPLASGDAYFGTSIKCNFDNSDALTALKKGETVTVRGEVDTQSIGIIGVNKCSVVN
jgi:hypothetical protein